MPKTKLCDLFKDGKVPKARKLTTKEVNRILKDTKEEMDASIARRDRVPTWEELHRTIDI